MSAATSPAVGLAKAAARTPMSEQADAEAGRCHRADPSARDRPLGPFDPVEVAIEDVVQDDAAGVEAGGRTEQPQQRPAVGEAGDGVARKHVGQGSDDVGGTDELEPAIGGHGRSIVASRGGRESLMS